MEDNKTLITLAIIAAITISIGCGVSSYFSYKTEVFEAQQETERALKQDKKTTIDFGFGQKDK